MLPETAKLSTGSLTAMANASILEKNGLIKKDVLVKKTIGSNDGLREKKGRLAAREVGILVEMSGTNNGTKNLS